MMQYTQITLLLIVLCMIWCYTRKDGFKQQKEHVAQSSHDAYLMSQGPFNYYIVKLAEKIF